MSYIDALIGELDNALRTLNPPRNRAATRSSPAQNIDENELSSAEKKHTAGLMRINHAGEVCAQALYQGQALTAKLEQVKQQMALAAAEETDHLAWCEERLQQLQSHTSLLNPLWYCSSLLLGALAGIAGDQLSLSFVAETERQVTNHLQNHLNILPKADNKSSAILQQMQEDETQHAHWALEAGGKELPEGIKKLMAFVSKLMTKTSYYI
jgi:ubiquinone biosynthesis monooxygenase Coq7